MRHNLTSFLTKYRKVVPIEVLRSVFIKCIYNRWSDIWRHLNVFMANFIIKSNMELLLDSKNLKCNFQTCETCVTYCKLEALIKLRAHQLRYIKHGAFYNLRYIKRAREVRDLHKYIDEINQFIHLIYYTNMCCVWYNSFLISCNGIKNVIICINAVSVSTRNINKQTPLDVN